LPSIVFHVGAGDTYRGVSVHYVRVDGIPATYAVARGSIRGLLDAL
jgi:tetrahydromethanopterin S-methyltransferase subunit D